MRRWKDMDGLGTGELWGSLLLILICFHRDSSQSFGEGVDFQGSDIQLGYAC